MEEEEEKELSCDKCGSDQPGFTFHASYNVSGWVKLCRTCLNAAQHHVQREDLESVLFDGFEVIEIGEAKYRLVPIRQGE